MSEELRIDGVVVDRATARECWSNGQAGAERVALWRDAAGHVWGESCEGLVASPDGVLRLIADELAGRPLAEVARVLELAGFAVRGDPADCMRSVIRLGEQEVGEVIGDAVAVVRVRPSGG